MSLCAKPREHQREIYQVLIILLRKSFKSTSMKSNIYQIRVKLNGSEPEIWRRLLVPSDVPLGDLHKILQTAMGWTNSHLHQFIKDRTFYEPPAPEGELWDNSGIDYTGMTLNEFLLKKNDTIEYEYDFGDGWNHTIKLENMVEKADVGLPVCIGGAMNCPPEDCGGIWGFQEFKKIMKNPDHPEYENYFEWYGGEYDPEAFDMEAVNEMLQDDNYGVFEW